MRLRSLLFVPAKEKMIQKIPSLDCDAVILDLEDSIEQKDKENALMRVGSFLETFDRSMHIYVRLNAESFFNEMQYLHRVPNVGFMLPKFENVETYMAAEMFLRDHSIIALVETPAGLVNIRSIAACEWVDAIAFGAEDYTAKANMTNSVQALAYQKSRLVMYAKAFDKPVYDTPSFQLDARDMFEEEVLYAVNAGFDGKMAITPKHVAYINQSFGCCDVDFYKQVIKRFEETGQAVCKIDGRVYEKMHIDRMKRIIKENGGN